MSIITQKTMDPREVVKTDEYDLISDDEEDFLKVKQRLNELKDEEKALEQRLESLNECRKRKDPNFVQVQVPTSPKKESLFNKSFPKTPKVSIEKSINDNELYLTSTNPPSFSTSYFSSMLSNVKKNQETNFNRNQEVLKQRIYTFTNNSNSMDYTSECVDEVEPFTNVHISKRYISSEQLNNMLLNIKVLRLPKLFAKVKPPKFEEPEYTNWAVVGIICSKSEVKFTNTKRPTKYFSLKLTDFNFTLSIFFFGKENVEKYFKLKIGDVIAILNPEISRWQHSGEYKSQGQFFHLRISHNFNSVLEIGSSKYFGFCVGINKLQGSSCNNPVDKSLNRFCSYHQELRMRVTNAKRIELNGNISSRTPCRDGIPQSLYIHKLSNRTKDNYGLLPDNCMTKGISKDIKGIHNFSTANAAKAFFNNGFQNPDIIRNLETKRRKIKDMRKEKNLTRSLNKILSKDYIPDFVKTSGKDSNQIKETTKSVLKSGIMNNLGFDPTNGRIGIVLGSESKANEDGLCDRTIVNDLLNIKKNTINLKPSEEEKIKKAGRREQVWKHHFGNTKEYTTSFCTEDSSDELEII